MSDSITLKHTGYRVTGTAYVTLWGGDKVIDRTKIVERWFS